MEASIVLASHFDKTDKLNSAFRTTTVSHDAVKSAAALNNRNLFGLHC